MLALDQECNFNMKYIDEIKKAMILLSQNEKTIFIGQSIKYGGTGLYDTLIEVNDDKKIEWPVAEYSQLGASIGMALEGFIVVSLFPRWNFLLMATDQIVNHLDKLPIISEGRCAPKVIIRVSVGSESPVDPQCQHKGNFSQAFRLMCKTIDIIELIEPEDIVPAYEKALNRTDGKSSILVEFADFLKTK
jgi:pyruvate/2-oxoglutarate/acetoin dehydrogenase E1 component